MSPFEKDHKYLEDQVKIKDAILRLYQNEDFKLVIQQEYLINNCARLAKLGASSRLNPADREFALQSAKAAGVLEDFLLYKISCGEQAEKDLEDLLSGSNNEE